MSACSDFERLYGKETLNAWLRRAGIHAAELHPVPEDRDQQLFYALLEGIGYDCWKYGDAPSAPSEKETEAFLQQHRREIQSASCPDYVSLLAGRYNFLKSAEAKA